MKKLTTKLTLNKTTIASLDNQAMAAVKGGLTYALSTGELCRHSKAEGAGSAYQCGLIDGVGTN